jgi:hypothetical protein
MMNIKLRHHCFKVLLCTFLAISLPSRGSVFAPGWREADKTVYAEWDTWTYNTNYPGDFLFTADHTGFGAGARKSFSPQAVQLSAPVTEIFSTYNNHQSVLKLNTDGFYVNLPNFLDGEEYTRVRFEICYDDTYASFADFQVWGLTDTGALPGYDGVYLSPAPVKSARDGSWVTEVYEFVIQPSPQWETIILRFDHYPTSPQNIDAPYIDYFSVDTICVPEPASLLLVALGTVLLRRSAR